VSLEKYKRKRDFTRTPEPSGEGDAGAGARVDAEAGPGAAPGARVDAEARPGAATAAGGRFVVQRHRARNLHYDFRLEIDGVLVSWAVPKGPTMDPGVRRGAYRVEDHPLDYFDFEGIIPARQYGAGDVIVWDWGRYVPEETGDPGRSVDDGELKFELAGEKLRGRFTIVRTRGGKGRPGNSRIAGGAAGGELAEARGAADGHGPGSDGGEREEWLLIKKRDGAAVPGWSIDDFPRSVKTRRTNDDVAAGVSAAEVSVGPVGPVASLPGSRLAAMPDFVEPMKATLADHPFSDPDWLFELKWDGYRVQAHVRDGRLALYTRRGHDAASYFPELAGPPNWLAAERAILDGEVVALNAAGEPDFHMLQAWGGSTGTGRTRDTGTGRTDGAASGRAGTLVYQVFDLLYLDGRSLLDVPLEDRKRLLASVLRGSATVRAAGHVDADGEAFYRAVSERKLEGMVAKLRRSRYEPGRRSASWLKIKRRGEQAFVIGGWSPRAGSETDLGALLIGVYDGASLRPAGRVGTGFDAAERAKLLRSLAPLERPTPPFRPAPRDGGIHWVEPQIVIRVEFTEWQPEGALRAPSYKGLDLDVDPGGVVRETPRPVAAARDDAEPARRAAGPPRVGRATIVEAVPASAEEIAALDALPSGGGRWNVGGRELKLSNLDKPIWPSEPITKRDLIRYYVAIAPYALPYLRDRALTVLRHPNGIDRPGFWQKQLPGHTPAWIARWSWPSHSAGELRDYVVADAAPTLAWLANEAAVDLHPSTFRIDAPDRPTWALVDIDPGTRTTWDEVLLLASLYRTALDHLHVAGFPKVSGQRGIQVWIPIRPIYTFEQTRDWVGGLSRAVGATMPELVSWEWEKTRRGGLARLDYTQNAANKTLVAPYAVRPAPGAPVSAPIAWAELDDPALRPNGWTIRTIFDRLAVRGDLFAPSLGLEQELPAL
jgi:bifunctional non-homologous end joining protein LigD